MFKYCIAAGKNQIGPIRELLTTPCRGAGDASFQYSHVPYVHRRSLSHVHNALYIHIATRIGLPDVSIADNGHQFISEHT